MLGDGFPCDAGNECYSGICGGGGNGLCCSHACPHDSTPECAPFGCSDAGACLYPPAGTICDKANESCTGSTLSTGACDGKGNCIKATIPCPNNFACDPLGEQCSLYCLSDTNCARGFQCDDDAGQCVQVSDGG